WTNNGTGTFTNSGQELVNRESFSVALGDLDGDGDLDAMVANNSQPNTVWTNDGNGTFTDSGQALGTSISFSVALGDLDGDGDLDAMVANLGQPNTVWNNDGNGTFTNSGQALGNGISISVALGDLDGDSDLDAMVANQNQPNTVWTNDVEPIATGACCVASGCTINTETACTELGGSWTESGSCDDCPTTCSADLNGDGTVDGQDLAAVLAAWGLPCDE
ncbi:MAG: FG-GAP-like repeat-containing protein, partial [Actinomycetota bacterium]|nr:FG-GAP-like repeat-containing protein [Actinomycetota bacterium]